MAALEACPARNRMLILDCCHAGAVVNMTGLKGAAETVLAQHIIPPDNYAVLMASGQFDRAKELEVGVSFFTDSLCAALSDKFHEADKDKDNRISVADMSAWLSVNATKHNEQFPQTRFLTHRCSANTVEISF
jgi:hypothetical protein